MHQNDIEILKVLRRGYVITDTQSGKIFRTRLNRRAVCNRLVEIKGKISTAGYRTTGISCDGKIIFGFFHRIIWLSAHHRIPDGYVIHHKNNNKLDNRLSNLACVTAQQNYLEAVQDQRYLKGEKNPAAKLTEKIVKKLREDYRRKIGGCYILAKKYGLKICTINRVLQKTTWKHVK